MQPQPHDEAIWYVVRLINNNLADNTDRVIYSMYDFRGDESEGKQPALAQQLVILKMLQELGVFTFNEDEQRAELYQDPSPLFVYSYELSIKNIVKFNALYEQHQKLERRRLDAQPISLSYDPTSGIGLINGSRELKLRGKNKRVFNRLYADANKWVGRTAILKAVGYRHGYGTKQAGIDYNTLITNLRKATALKPQHIVVHDGQLMLKAAIAHAQS